VVGAWRARKDLCLSQMHHQQVLHLCTQRGGRVQAVEGCTRCCGVGGWWGYPKQRRKEAAVSTEFGQS
jgi:hypothetical protein